VHLKDPRHHEHSPLFYSIKQGSREALEIMISGSGFNIDNVKNNQGFSPL